MTFTALILEFKQLWVRLALGLIISIFTIKNFSMSLDSGWYVFKAIVTKGEEVSIEKGDTPSNSRMTVGGKVVDFSSSSRHPARLVILTLTTLMSWAPYLMLIKNRSAFQSSTLACLPISKTALRWPPYTLLLVFELAIGTITFLFSLLAEKIFPEADIDFYLTLTFIPAVLYSICVAALYRASLESISKVLQWWECVPRLCTLLMGMWILFRYPGGMLSLLLLMGAPLSEPYVNLAAMALMATGFVLGDVLLQRLRRSYV